MAPKISVGLNSIYELIVIRKLKDLGVQEHVTLQNFVIALHLFVIDDDDDDG